MDQHTQDRMAASASNGQMMLNRQSTVVPVVRLAFPSFLSAVPREKRMSVKEFNPSWFTVALGTSSVCTSLGICPLQFPGQVYIAWGLYLLAAVLFSVFSCLMLGRVLFHRNTLPYLFAHPNQSLFFGVIPMVVSSLTGSLPLLFGPTFGAGVGHAAAVLFWVNLPAVLLCIVLMPFTMFTVHDHSMHSMTAVWLLPVMPATLAGNIAGLTAANMNDVRHGGSLVFVGVALLGIGLPLSFQICTIYYKRLTVCSLPAREVIVSSFLPVGSMAMAALAMMDLAIAGRKHTIGYTKTHPEFTDATDETTLKVAANIILATGVFVAVMLWGYAIWWLLTAISSVIETLTQGVPFNLGWWGSVFPFGALTCATCRIALTTHARAFTWMGVVFVCCHVCMWLVVAGLTAARAWTGHLFHSPCLEESHASSKRDGASDTMSGSHGPGNTGLVSCNAAAEVEEQLQRVLSWSTVSHRTADRSEVRLKGLAASV